MTVDLLGGGKTGPSLYDLYVQVQTEAGAPVLPLDEWLDVANAAAAAAEDSADAAAASAVAAAASAALAANPNAPVAFVDGTAALPAITNQGDTNTGMYFPAADTIGFSTGGTQRAGMSSGMIDASVPVRVPNYTTAGLPGVGLSGAGAFSYATDATNGATPVVNDGAAWRRVALQDTAYPTHSGNADASALATNNLFQTPTGRVRIKRSGTVQEPLVYVDDFSHALDGDKWQAAIDAMGIRGGQIIPAARSYSIGRKLEVNGKAITVRGTYTHTSSRGTVLSFADNADYYLSVQGVDGMLLDGIMLFKSGVLGPVMKVEPFGLAEKSGNINLQSVFMAGGLNTFEVSNVLNLKAMSCRIVNTATGGKALFLDGRAVQPTIDVPEFVNSAFSANGTGATVVDIDGAVASAKFTACAMLFGEIGIHIHDSEGVASEGPSFVQIVSGGTENSRKGVVVESGKDLRFTGFYCSVDPLADDSHSPYTFTETFTNTAVISGGTVRGGRKYGIDANGGDLRVLGVHAGNNGGTDNIGIGIKLGAGMTSAVINASMVGNFPDGSPRQDYAIENNIGSAAVIVGNDLSRNSTNDFRVAASCTFMRSSRRAIATFSSSAIPRPRQTDNRTKSGHRGQPSQRASVQQGSRFGLQGCYSKKRQKNSRAHASHARNHAPAHPASQRGDSAEAELHRDPHHRRHGIDNRAVHFRRDRRSTRRNLMAEDCRRHGRSAVEQRHRWGVSLKLVHTCILGRLV